MVKKFNQACVLAINGGSSSIKFALFEAGDSLRWILGGGIEMTDHQIAAKVRENVHRRKGDFRETATATHVALGDRGK